MKTIRILGIDPGFGRVGYGIIEGYKNDWKHVVHGCIETSPKKSLVDRLDEVNGELKKIIDTYKPTCAAVEQLYFYNNVKTAIDVGQARGVILLTLRQANLPIVECTPLQVKQTITGYGKADKTQIQYMVSLMLKLPNKKFQDDAADALAVALACTSQTHHVDKPRASRVLG